MATALKDTTREVVRDARQAVADARDVAQHAAERLELEARRHPVAAVGAGHDEWTSYRAKEQSVQRRVGKHDAQLATPRCHVAGNRGSLAAGEQPDGTGGRRQERGLVR